MLFLFVCCFFRRCARLHAMAPDLAFEQAFWQAGHHYVAGLDEVGRGCLAGPVMAGAVVLPPDPVIGTLLRAAGLRDSKKLTAAQRERLLPQIGEVSLGWAVGAASAAEIDALGIVAACQLAMRRALAALPCPVECLLLDAFPLADEVRPQRAIVRGDDASLSIAAASVVAKVQRDRWMQALEQTWPGYGFASNKGYAAPAHRSALRVLGPTPQHRMTWKPLQTFTVEQGRLPLDE